MARYFTRLRLVKYLAISHADSCNKSYIYTLTWFPKREGMHSCYLFIASVQPSSGAVLEFYQVSHALQLLLASHLSGLEKHFSNSCKQTDKSCWCALTRKCKVCIFEIMSEVVSSPDHTFQAKVSLVTNDIILGFC